MRTFKRMASLCLMLLLLLSFPTALIVSAEELDAGQTASAQAEINTLDESIICQAASITQEENGGISLTSGGSEGGIVGGGTSGGGSSTWNGTARFISPGVTFEVITVDYENAYDRETVYNAVIQYLTDMKGVFGGAYSTVNTFILDTTTHPTKGGSLIRLLGNIAFC